VLAACTSQEQQQQLLRSLPPPPAHLAGRNSERSSMVRSGSNSSSLLHPSEPSRSPFAADGMQLGAPPVGMGGGAHVGLGGRPSIMQGSAPIGPDCGLSMGQPTYAEAPQQLQYLAHPSGPSQLQRE
jgi:hypothetical protein